MSSCTAARSRLRSALLEKSKQGYDTADMEALAASLPESYDALIDFARRIAALPRRPDWPFSEPDGLDAIHAECDPSRVLGSLLPIGPGDAAPLIETGFLASICGCILGKPVEFNLTLSELEAMLSAVGEWPITEYLSGKIIPGTIARTGGSLAYWNRTYREQIRFVMPDDDINYTLLGMLLLEAHGVGLTTNQVQAAWQRHLTVDVTFGPERSALADLALRSANEGPEFPEDWMLLLDGGERRGDAHCGAQIRADAYGYACPASPALAADLAYQDAVLTHRGTGLYATLWTAAALAAAFTRPTDPLDMFRIALQYIPQRSRFHEAVLAGLECVEKAANWRDGYDRVHARFPDCGHCCVYEESALLMNTLRFAKRVEEGLCVQVMQGSDTDSYAATAGALLGVYLGPELWDKETWLAPFQDDLRTGLSWFYDRSLLSVARRISDLPRRLAAGEVSGVTDR